MPSVSRSIEKPCAYCGAQFRSYVSQDRLYCSRECQALAYTMPDARRVQACEQCGAPFTCYVSQRRRFCSRQCAYLGRAMPTKRRVQRRCAYCGEPFSRVPSQDGPYCSRACAARSQSKPRPAVPERPLRQPPPPLDDAQIVAMYGQGLSIAEIMRTLGTTSDRITLRLQKAGIPLHPAADGLRGRYGGPRVARVPVTCPECGTVREWLPCQAKDKTYCSRRCSLRASGRKRRKEKPLVTCLACGQTVPSRNEQPKSGRQRYCSTACANYARHQQRRSGAMRTLERIIEALLVAHDIASIPQWRLNNGSGMSADFYLPDLRRAIECDGDYWHALPRQKRPNMRKERAYHDLGIPVLHLTETEIMTDIRGCHTRLMAFVSPT